MPRLAALVALLAGALLAVSVLPAEAAKGAPIHLQLLAVNDLRGQLEPLTLDGRPVGGAAVLGTYLAQAVHDADAEGASSLILGGGDLFGSSPPVSNLLDDRPIIEALGLMGLRYSALGNHELNDGIRDFLGKQYGGCRPGGDCRAPAPYQYLAANVIDRTTGQPVLPAYAIEKVGRVEVGIIGVAFRDTPTIVTPAGVASLEFLDEAESVNRYVPVLRARGIETIIVLLHGSGAGDLEGGPITGPLVPIVEALDGAVDVVMTGHSETGFVGTVDGKLVTQAYADGTAFAAIDLVIDRKSGDVVSKQGRVVRTWGDVFPGSTPHPQIEQLIQRSRSAVAPLIDRVVGLAGAPITREQSPAGESALGDLIADAQRAKGGTQLAFLNPGSMRADIEAGEVTWGELFAVQPFRNAVIRMTLTGAQVERLLEQQWQGQPEPRILQLSGLRYRWSPDAPVGDRIRPEDIEVGDATLDLAATYTVTVNNFIATGGDSFTVLLEGVDREVVGGTDGEALVEYVEALPRPFEAATDGRIGLR
ncbi:MAG: bifunctional metallophosphatase/5'-nucleotidase [Dehalococcoidia bacterium]